MNPEERIAGLEKQVAQLTFLLANHQHKGYDGTKKTNSPSPLDLNNIPALSGYFAYLDSNGNTQRTYLQYLEDVLGGSHIFNPIAGITVESSFLLALVGSTVELLAPTGFTIIGGTNATNSNTNMLIIPNCAGVPTGTPATTPAFVYDTTNNDFYCYNAGAWRKVHLA